jgi:hypothetical protein
MKTKRNSSRRTASLVLALAISAMVAVVKVSAMKYPKDYCSENVTDCRSGICYNGCGGIDWGATWCHIFGYC